MKPNTSKQLSYRKKHRQKADRIWIFGFHAVEAALNNNNRKLFRLLATKNSFDKLQSNNNLTDLPTTIAKPQEFQKYLAQNSVHQGLALEASPLDWGSLNEVGLENTNNNVVIILDRVKDPQNVGAIIRSTEVLGGSAVIGSTHHCAPETGALVKAASGAYERTPYITVPNISRAIELLVEKEFKIIGLDHSGDEKLVDLLKSLKKRRIAFILGSEGSGLRDLTKKKCDHLVQISANSTLSVLNVSNAAAVTLFAAKEFL